MKNYLVLCLTLTLIACGPSQKDRDIAAVTCAVMGETRIMDAAIRVREMNEARKKIGGEPFLRGDNAIKEAFEYGLCEELVLNVAYDESLKNLIDAKRERERIAAEKRAEEIRIAAEKRAEEERIAAEKKAEEQRIAAEKQRIANSTPTVKEEFYSNGELKKRRNYQSKDDGGKQHGLYRWWRENGQLREETAYENGEKHGPYRYWDEDGQLKYEYCYSNGEFFVDMSNCTADSTPRVDETFYPNGELKSRTNYHSKNDGGDKHGLTSGWTENGQLKYEYCYSNGEIADMSNCQE